MANFTHSKRENGRYVSLVQVSKEWLEDNYIKQGKLCKEIAEELGCCRRHVTWLLRKHGIAARPKHKWIPGEDPAPDHLLLERSRNWKGGRATYRQIALAVLPPTCMFCGKAAVTRLRTNLHVHHIDGDRANNAVDNLAVICASCHKKLHNLGFRARRRRHVPPK